MAGLAPGGSTTMASGTMMNTKGTLHRRDVLRIALVFGVIGDRRSAIGALAPLRFALAQSTLRHAPDQILDPF
jgi:hypothetical protein